MIATWLTLLDLFRTKKWSMVVSEVVRWCNVTVNSQAAVTSYYAH